MTRLTMRASASTSSARATSWGFRAAGFGVTGVMRAAATATKIAGAGPAVSCVDPSATELAATPRRVAAPRCRGGGGDYRSWRPASAPRLASRQDAPRQPQDFDADHCVVSHYRLDHDPHQQLAAETRDAVRPCQSEKLLRHRGSRKSAPVGSHARSWACSCQLPWWPRRRCTAPRRSHYTTRQGARNAPLHDAAARGTASILAAAFIECKSARPPAMAVPARGSVWCGSGAESVV